LTGGPSTALVTGASGALGWVLGRMLADRLTVIATYNTHASHPDGTRGVPLDLADIDALGCLLETYRPQTIFHLAAVTDPDRCERDPETARVVNLEATKELAVWSAAAKAKLVFASTDLVFDGKKGNYCEEDHANPLSVYGRTKLQAEQAVLEVCPGAAVIRGSLFYGLSGPAGRTFLSGLLDALASHEKTRLFTDQKRNPILLEDLAGAMIRVADLGLEGVFHAGGADVVTRYEFGRTVCAVFGFDESLLVPIGMADFHHDAPRPLDSTLDIKKITKAIGFEPTSMPKAMEAIKARMPGS
jgi:dTDP-4-dehydrorhamnose reductase